MSDNLILEVKPKFVGVVRFFSVNIATAIAVIYSLLVFFVMFKLSGLTTLYLSICLFFLVWMLLVFLDKKNYEVSYFRVFKDRVELEEGFIMHKHRVMKLADIKEVHLVQNLFQRMGGVGTIRFVSAANSSPYVSGVRFVDIENSEAIYKEVKQLFENQ